MTDLGCRGATYSLKFVVVPDAKNGCAYSSSVIVGENVTLSARVEAERALIEIATCT